MASLEKLVRTVEALKLHQTPSVSLDETMSKKEKISHCVSVTDILCSQGMKSSPDSAKYLAMAMEMYFTLLDDADSDMRMLADENLNRVIRCIGESSIPRIQVELYKEMKKNGSSRCVRGALWRFAHLASHIRPNKRRTYVNSLLPCFTLLAQRSEEAVHETMSTSLPRLLQVLSSQITDGETHSLIKIFLENLSSANPVIRRTTANNLLSIAIHSRKPDQFLAELVDLLIKKVTPYSHSTSNYLVLGVLALFRQILPKLNDLETYDLHLNIYEICMMYLSHKDHNVVNSCLEVLQQILKFGPTNFIHLLQMPGSATNPFRMLKEVQKGNASNLQSTESCYSISEFGDQPVEGGSDLANNSFNSMESTQKYGEEGAPVEEIDFEEDDAPLALLARYLSQTYLLTTEKGTVVDDSKVRVSVKALALLCLSEVLLIMPEIWFVPVFEGDLDEFTSVFMSDLVYFLEHEDPVLRGNASKLICVLLKGACIRSCGELDKWFEGKQQNEEELSNLVVETLKDASSITVRNSLSGINSLLPSLLLSSSRSSIALFLNSILSLMNTSYWLIKVELCDLISNLNPVCCTYIDELWPKNISRLLMHLVCDDDARVRTSAASSLAKCMFAIPGENSELHCEFVKNTVGKKSNNSSSIQSQRFIFSQEGVEFSIISNIFELFKSSTEKTQMYGYAEALYHIIQKYPAHEYPHVWGVHQDRSDRTCIHAESQLKSPACAYFAFVVQNLISNLACIDWNFHGHLLEIASSLFCGIMTDKSRTQQRTVRKDPIVTNYFSADDFEIYCEKFLVHVTKLMSIAHHVLENSASVSSKSPMPSLQSSALSPIKKKSSETSVQLSPTEKNPVFKEEKKTWGSFQGNPYYMKMFEIFKSSYSVYKTSLEGRSTEKLESYINVILKSFTSIMDFTDGFDLGKYVEEYLSYLKSCITFSAATTLIAVQSLLKCLFKMNKTTSIETSSKDQSPFEKMSIFDTVISNSYRKFTAWHGLNIADVKSTPDNSQDVHELWTGRNPFRSSNTGSDRATLASYIRLFEPMVIKALKLYTVSSQVETQVEVLQLLIQLIKLRVNYCLLDSDQIFIGFVQKQLSFEDGYVVSVEDLIPQIFEFLLLLSYENYHSRIIIDIPSILQLCEGFSASGLTASAYTIPALKVVANDLFLARNPSSDKELDTQKEVVISMLLRHLNSTAVFETFSDILACLKREENGEEKARILSKQILESLLPLLNRHCVDIESKDDLDAILELFRSLSASVLRPCDNLISYLLSSNVDISSIKELQGWLAFTIAAFITIMRLCPEDAFLGKLQELGIMLGSGTGSILMDSSIDNSMESSTESDPLRKMPNPPEFTVVTFLFHSIGAAVSKYVQLIFSPTNKLSGQFLVHEMEEMMLIMTYVLQSGYCPRMFAAACHLAKQSQPDMLYNIDTITKMILDLKYHNPTIVIHWIYILILLDKVSLPLWAGFLNTGTRFDSTRLTGKETAEKALVLELEVIRRASLSAVANYLVEKTGDGELLAWVLSSQIKDLVQNVQEIQIKELITVIHRQSPSSGLFLGSVIARYDSLKATQVLAQVLKCLGSVHKNHTGRLLDFLINKFLILSSKALGLKASREICKRLESLLGEREEFVLEQLPHSDLSNIMQIMAKKSMTCRYNKISVLLNRLSVSFYDLSPVDMAEGRKFNAGTISNISLDKSWYIHQVKRICCSNAPPPECAKLLSSLRFSDIMVVLTAKDFNIKILEECLVQGIFLPDGSSTSIDSLDRLPALLSDPERSPGMRDVGLTVKEGPPLYRAASQVLLQHIKNLIELLPRPLQIYRAEAHWQVTSPESKYNHKLDDFFSQHDGQHLIVQLLPAFTRLLLTYPRLPGRRPTLPPHAMLEMVRFGALAVELIKWLVASCREDIEGKEQIISMCLGVASLTFTNIHLVSILASATHNTLVCSAAIAIYDYIASVVPISAIPNHPSQRLSELSVKPHPSPILVASLCLSRLLMYFEDHEFENITTIAFDVVIGLARLPQFSSITRAPPMAFTMGWDPEVTEDENSLNGTVPSTLLQELEVLEQVIWRLNALGWTNRSQFEENWMSLLSVLNVSHDELSAEELGALSQSTAVVVHGLSSLLVATLGIPVAGIPGTLLLHHPRDSPNAFLLTGRGQQLTAIQNIIHQWTESKNTRSSLPVDSSVNLERAFVHRSQMLFNYSPVPASRYGHGQISLSYISTSLLYHEENSADDRQSLASSTLPIFLLLREENLAAAGLDINSCSHFLIDLFSQWLNFNSQDTPLIVLTSAVRGIVLMADVFTKTSQYTWMANTLSDIHKVHPVEDDIMASLLCVGMAKSIAVTGNLEPDTMDRLKRSIETGLRSPHLFCQTAAVHGALYLLQGDLGTDLQPLLSVLMDYLKGHLMVGRGNYGVEDNIIVTWSLLFYILENFFTEIGDKESATEFIQLCITTSGKPDLPRPLYICLLSGLERLVVANIIKGKQMEQVIKLATDLMTEWAPVSVLPSVQLFLAAMYTSHPPSSDPSQKPAPITDPELLMQMMEQLSILFDCVRRAGPAEAELLAEILPQVLVDFFPASDVVNRVISEFISPGQPHPHLMAGVLKQIFKAAVAQDQQMMLTEWVLVSLPNFTRRSSIQHSIWCLSCFFLAASPNPWLQAMFPHLLHRPKSWAAQPVGQPTVNIEERRLFCLAATDFYSRLTDKKQKQKFIETFESAAECGNPFADLLGAVELFNEKQTQQQDN